MTNNEVNCLFCFADPKGRGRRSREHLVSKPVAKAFGIDLKGGFLRIDLNTQEHSDRPLSGIALRRVCTACNNGWMNRLERAMGDIAEWLSGPDDELGVQREYALRRWAIKTHLLLCFLEGEAGEFGDDDNDRAVVPPMTLARELHGDNADAIAATAVGIAWSSGEPDFAMAFGHPKMRWTGPKRWNARFSPASTLTIGDLQLWVVTPHLDAEVSAPENVIPLTPSVRPSTLRERPHASTVEEVVVDYGEDHDAEALIAELIAWAASQSPDGAAD